MPPLRAARCHPDIHNPLRWLRAGHTHMMSRSDGPRVKTVETKAAMTVQITTVCRNVPVWPKPGSGLAAARSRHIQPITIRCARSTTARPNRSGRPGKSATNGVDRVENNDRDAPNAEARHEPPEAPEWNGKRAHGRGAPASSRARATPGRGRARWLLSSPCSRAIVALGGSCGGVPGGSGIPGC